MDIGSETSYGKDMKVLWAAYKAGSFDLPNWSQDEFAKHILLHLSNYDSVWIVEDKNKVFTDKGPIAVILVRTDGSMLIPDVDYFKWATPRNILRTAVTFFQWIRYSKDVGVCVFGSNSKSKNLYERMREYGIMVWHIGNGYYGLAGKKCLQH